MSDGSTHVRERLGSVVDRLGTDGADEVMTERVFERRHSGAPGIAHGGAVATVVDDVLGFLLSLEGLFLEVQLEHFAQARVTP